MVSFRLNGENVEVPSNSLHLSAAAFIRQHTQVTVSLLSQPVCVASNLDLLLFSSCNLLTTGASSIPH